MPDEGKDKRNQAVEEFVEQFTPLLKVIAEQEKAVNLILDTREEPTGHGE